MEFRTNNIIINVDEKLNNEEDAFVKAMAYFIDAVIKTKTVGLASYLMRKVVAVFLGGKDESGI